MRNTLRTDLLTGARKQKVIIECHQEGNERPEWWTMLHTGAVQVFDTADAAHKAVQQAAKPGNKTVTITIIEWRNVPDGFKPPEGR